MPSGGMDATGADHLMSAQGWWKPKVFKKTFRFLGFNVYAQSHAEHWTQEYDQLKTIHVD